MKTKRGTYLIEAAVVFPIVILTVLTVILIVMYFYDCSASQSNMHILLRQEAGIASGKSVYYETHPRDDFYLEQNRKTVSASKDVSMLHRGVLYGEGYRTIQSTVHMINGPKYVLRRQLLDD